MTMNSIIRLRRKNLLALIRDRYANSQTNFSTATGISLSQMGQWLADEDNPNVRNMSERSARKIENKASLSDGWMDQDHDSEKPHNGLFVNDPGAEYIGLAPKQTLMPVSGYAKMGTNGWYEEISAPGADGYVEASSSDPDAYVLRVKGDSMHPAIRNGWYVLVEPSKQPSFNRYAAIRLRDGRKMVKEFLSRNQDNVTVESVNGGERLTISLEDIDVIHAIGAILMSDKHTP